MNDKKSNSISHPKLPWIVAIAALIVSAYCLYKVGKVPKIGIVDNAVLLQQFTEAIKAKQELQAEQDKWQKNTRIIEDSLQAVMKDMTDSGKAKSKAENEVLQRRLEKWNKEYADYSEALKRLAPKLEAEKFKPVLNKLNMFVDNWGKEHHYDAIYGTGNGGVVLMRAPQHDITSQILADLNNLYKSETASVKNDSSATLASQTKKSENQR